MTKREELDDPQSCLGKAADDEPVFVLRAQDRVAPAVVRFWAREVARIGGHSAKTDAALVQSAAMERWQESHGCKVPD